MQELRGEYAAANQTLTRAHDLFTRLGDRRGQANALLGVGRVQYRQGEYTKAADTLSRAHILYTELGARLGRPTPSTTSDACSTCRAAYETATDSLTRAHNLFTELDNRLGQANVLTNLGRMQYLRNTYPTATDILTQAHDVYSELCDPDGQAEVLNYLGDLALEHPAAGDPFEIFSRALTISRDIGTAAHEAHALSGQAQCLIRAGKNAEAIALLQQAHDIYDALGSLKAHNVKETLITAEDSNCPQ